MKLRMATMADIDMIVSLRMQMLHEVADTIPSELQDAVKEYLNRHMADKTCLCALGEMDGIIAAKAMLCIYDAMPDETNISGRYARLFSVYTLPAYRGKGYMKGLLCYLLNEAGKYGVQEVFASAEEKAIPLYERIGFRLLESEMHLKMR